MFVLDTNVVSQLRRPERADPKVVAWALSMPVASFFLSAITVLELELGALLMERRDKAQGLVLRSWIDEQIMPRFDGRVLAIDAAVAQRCARLHVPNPRAERDALIAATALVHGMTVVTRNSADFEFDRRTNSQSLGITRLAVLARFMAGSYAADTSTKSRGSLGVEASSGAFRIAQSQGEARAHAHPRAALALIKVSVAPRGDRGAL